MGWLGQLLSEDRTFKQRLEGSERLSHMGVWGQGGPGRRGSKCKGREVGVWLAPGVHPESTWVSHFLTLSSSSGEGQC